VSDVDLLIEAFRRNGRVNDVLLNTLTDADLDFPDEEGVMSIGQLLEHMASTRKSVLRQVAPQLAQQIMIATEDDEEHVWASTLTLQELHEVFVQGDSAVTQAVQDAVAQGHSFKKMFSSHPAHLLTMLIAYDADNRSQVMSLLRQAGSPPAHIEKLNAATWPIWRE
jgi:uncharacterized damage-inducible protein DinB